MIDQTFIDQFKPRSIEHNTVCITEGTYLSATHLGIAMFVAKVDEGPPAGFGPHSGPMAAPDWEPDMEVAGAKAAAKSEQEVARIAVTDAQLNGFEDDREFDTAGRIWMLNLLKFEPGE